MVLKWLELFLCNVCSYWLLLDDKTFETESASITECLSVWSVIAGNLYIETAVQCFPDFFLHLFSTFSPASFASDCCYSGDRLQQYLNDIFHVTTTIAGRLLFFPLPRT